MGRLIAANLFWRQQMALSGISLMSLLWLIYWIEPEFVADIFWKESYLPLFVFFWLTWFWLFTAMSARWKRSLLWSGSLTVWLWLRLMQLDTLLTVGLLVAFNVVWTYYWKLNKDENIQK
jgi:hypothetical protein